MHTAAPGYSTEEYAYGTEPNTFLAAHFAQLPKGLRPCARRS